MRKDVTIDEFIQVLTQLKEDKGNIPIGVVEEAPTEYLIPDEEDKIGTRAYIRYRQYHIQVNIAELVPV